MKFHHVPAASVAFIKAGKLEWAAAWAIQNSSRGQGRRIVGDLASPGTARGVPAAVGDRILPLGDGTGNLKFVLGGDGKAQAFEVFGQKARRVHQVCAQQSVSQWTIHGDLVAQVSRKDREDRKV